MKRRATAILGSSLVLTLHAAGQGVLHEIAGEQADQSLGWSVGHAGDVDADGHADWIIGAPFTDVGGVENVGVVRVISGLDGALLYEFEGSHAYEYFGMDVDGAGDLNGDGHDDFLTGTHLHKPAAVALGRVVAWSGLDGSQLHEIIGTLVHVDFGRHVAGAGDVNADGFDDFIVGAPGTDANGASGTVYSGLDGSVLHQVFRPTHFIEFGAAVSAAGDIDGDGFADFAVCAPASDTGSFDAGEVFVYSGADGALLMSRAGLHSNSFFGRSVASAGDLDGDGKDDLVVGAPGVHLGGVSAGAIYALRGFDGAVLFAGYGHENYAALGWDVGSVGDLNGDGVREVLGGAPTSPGAGSVAVFSGADGAQLLELVGGDVGDLFGRSVAGGGDADGDGWPEIVIGAQEENGGASDSGVARVYRGGCLGVDRYCTAAPNSTGSGAGLYWQGTTSVADGSITLLAWRLPSMQLGLFYYGAQAVQLPFGDGFRCVGGATLRLGPPGQANFTGELARVVDFDQPPMDAGPGAVTAGSTWHFQCWYRDPAGAGGSHFNLSDGLSARFCP